MSNEHERIGAPKRTEGVFYDPGTKLFGFSPPVDFNGNPMEAELPVGLEESCRHHWEIESPEGSTSHGRCKLCCEQRYFANSHSEYVWENGRSGKAWRAHRGSGIGISSNGSDEEDD